MLRMSYNLSSLLDILQPDLQLRARFPTLLNGSFQEKYKNGNNLIYSPSELLKLKLNELLHHVITLTASDSVLFSK